LEKRNPKERRKLKRNLKKKQKREITPVILIIMEVEGIVQYITKTRKQIC